MLRYTHQNAWTLLETLLTIGLAIILCAVTLPEYHSFLMRAQREYAKTYLMSLSIELEDYYLKNGQYPRTTWERLEDIKLEHPTLPYDFSLRSNNAAYYLLQATPQSQQALDPCGILSVDSNGVKHAAHHTCWNL